MTEFKVKHKFKNHGLIERDVRFEYFKPTDDPIISNKEGIEKIKELLEEYFKKLYGSWQDEKDYFQWFNYINVYICTDLEQVRSLGKPEKMGWLETETDNYLYAINKIKISENYEPMGLIFSIIRC